RRQSGVENLPLPAQIRKRTELVRGGDLRIDTVELVQVDPLETQAAQAPVDSLAQMIRPPVLHPPSGARALEAALGRNHQPLRIGVQSLGDQALTDFRPV